MLRRLLCLLLVVSFLAALAGCEEATSQASSAANAPPKELTDAELQAALDGVIGSIYNNRKLDTSRNAAWQVMHGVVAFERDLEIRHSGKLVNAIDFVQKGGKMEGWVFQHGDTDLQTGRVGLRAVVQPGSKTGQGHPDQWLGYMAQCGLAPNEPLVIDGHAYTIADYIWQIQQDVYRNGTQEYSWTLMALTSYLPSDAQWIAGDGSEWSIEKLVEIEAAHDLKDSACGGSHRLGGLTMALNQHLSQNGKIEGAWADADRVIRESIATVKAYQNPNGTFSSNYFIRPSAAVSVADQISTTGHTLEFLMLAMTDEEIRQPWVRRAVTKLCQLFRTAEKIDLECGGLYHGAHGLILYRERMFGAMTFGDES